MASVGSASTGTGTGVGTTGLAAPAVYRQGGFVAIDMLDAALPRRAAAASPSP